MSHTLNPPRFAAFAKDDEDNEHYIGPLHDDDAFRATIKRAQAQGGVYVAGHRNCDVQFIPIRRIVRFYLTRSDA